MYLNTTDTAVKHRQALELRIVKAVITEALRQGYALSVYDGGERFPVTTDKATLLDQLMNTDEDYLFIHAAREYRENCGWVRFVYGNGGWDVICDYSDNDLTESILIPANKIADGYDQ